jgi:hypothetical protein
LVSLMHTSNAPSLAFQCSNQCRLAMHAT